MNNLNIELRGSDNQKIVISKGSATKLNFIVFSPKKDIKIFQEAYSWGYYSRTFILKDPSDDKRIYKITRRQIDWDEDGPLVNLIKKGDFIIANMDFCDAGWKAKPAIPITKEIFRDFILTGQFEIKPSDEASKQNVWTGSIQSKPIEVQMASDCIKILNSD